MASVLWSERSIAFSAVSLGGGGIPALNALIPPTAGVSAAPQIAYDVDSGVYYGLATGVGPSLQWTALGNGAAPGINVETFSGGPAHTVDPGTDLVLLDLGGATATLTLPSLAAQQPGRNVRVVLLSDGFVTIQAAGADALWSGADTLNLGCTGDSALLTPTSEWRLTDLFGSLVDFIVYVETTGDDTAPGTALAPLATVAEALVRAARLGWTRYGIVRLGAGTFAQPAGAALLVPGARGSSARPLQIIGTELDSGLPPLSISAYTPPVNADGPIGATITIAAPLLGATDYKGWRVRLTGGTSTPAVNGMSFMVAGNTPNTITICDLYRTLNPGDTFVLERPDTALEFSQTAAPTRTFPAIAGAPLLLRSARINSLAQRVFVSETLLMLQHVWIDMAGVGFKTLAVFGGAEVYSGLFTLGWFGPRTTPGDNLDAIDPVGIYLFGTVAQNGMEMRENGMARLYESVCENASVFGINDSFVEFGTSAHYGNGYVGTENGGSCVGYASQWTGSVPGAGRGALYCKESTMSAYGCGFDSVTGSAIKLVVGSTGDVTGCVGGLNSGYGLELRSGSKCQINNAIPNSVNGALGDVRVGSPVLAVPWVTASTNANDLVAGAASELCWTGA